MRTPHCSLAILAALLVSSVSAGATSAGVCYSPWHHDAVNSAVIQKDFAQMKEHFSVIRTFHARFSGLNVIDQAAQAGVKVAVGVMMQDRSQIANEIAAVCDGAKRNPSAVQYVYLGNENLKNGGFGSFSGAELVGYINQVKGCVSNLKIPVGTVQRINEWLSAPDAAMVAGASDVIGVNIYPFFTPGSTKPVDKLDAQWKQMAAKYPQDKLRVTETGWPRAGGSSSGNVANKETTQSYLNDFVQWGTSKPQSTFFMMYDSKVSYSGAEYEKYFGLADTNGVLQVSIPGGNGQSPPAPAATQAAAAPASTSPLAPVAPAPAAPAAPAQPAAPAAPATPAKPAQPAAPAAPAAPAQPAAPGAPATPAQPAAPAAPAQPAAPAAPGAPAAPAAPGAPAAPAVVSNNDSGKNSVVQNDVPAAPSKNLRKHPKMLCKDASQ